jgi:hypothetical protein
MVHVSDDGDVAEVCSFHDDSLSFVYRENQAGGEEIPGDWGFRGSKWACAKLDFIPCREL